MRTGLALVLVFGCAPEQVLVEGDVVLPGEHIDIEIEEGLEPCGDLVGHMDRFIELVAGVWGVDLEDRHYMYRWVLQETFIVEDLCFEGALGCAHGHDVDSYAAPVDHELVHLVSFAVGVPPSFFMEGAAVVFELPSAVYDRTVFSRIPWNELSITDDLLTASRLPGAAYDLAGAYTRYLIDRFGMDGYLGFYAGLKRPADRKAIALVHQDAFGESLDATIAAFGADRRGCEYEQFRFKLFECAAPGLERDGDVWRLGRGVSCDEDDVVGPFYLGTSAATWATFTVDTPGLFELSSIGEGAGVRVTIASCGGCESAPPIEAEVGAGPQRMVLDAGPHYLQLDISVGGAAQVWLELRRVAP